MKFLIYFILFIFGPTCLVAQLNTFEFTESIKGVFRLVDLGEFEKADSILIEVDSSSWAINSRNRSDYYFARGYKSLFSSGKLSSLDDFVQAGQVYTKLGELRYRDLIDVFLVVDLYVKSQWVVSKRRAHELLDRIPVEEEELHAILYNILSACYCGTPPNIQEGHKYGQLAISYFNRHKNHRRLVSLYGLMAACLSEVDQPSRMLYLDSAVYHAKAISHEKQLAFLQIRKARAFQFNKEYKKALFELSEAKKYFARFPTEQGQIEWIYTIESLIYSEMEDYKKAYEILEQNRLQSIEVRSNRIDEQINSLRIKYESAQKEHDLAIQKLELKNQRQKIMSQKLIGIGVALFIVTLFGILIWRNRQKHLDQRRKDDMRHQKKLLDSTMRSVEAERKRISQDLHDGVGQKLTGLKMAWQQIVEELPKQSEGELQKLTSVLNDTTSEVRQISHQLMPASLRKLGIIDAIEDCLEQTLSPTNKSFEFDYIQLNDRLPEEVEIGLYRVVQELLSNIVKHSKANEVKMQLFKLNDQLVLTLQENGQGFRFDENMNSGNGLYNIESRIKSLNGFIEFENQPNDMQITIRIPIQTLRA